MPEVVTALEWLAATAVASYLLGAIPFGIVISSAFGLGDPREFGSKSIGATNVLRTGNKLAAALTLILDAFKGGIAVLIARSVFGEDAAQIAGLFAILGHMFPVYLRFKGGKGVATAFGTILVLAWPVGLILGGIWLLTAIVFRISSLAALVTTTASPLVAGFMGSADKVILFVVLAILIFERHKANVRRLLSGEEPRIGKKS